MGFAAEAYCSRIGHTTWFEMCIARVAIEERKMIKKDKATQDSFASSLGGVTVVAGFLAMPVIPHEGLRQRFGEKLSRRELQRLRARTSDRVRVA